MDWRREIGAFAADRLCLGLIELSGRRFPAKSVPEWNLVPDYANYLAENPTIDAAESDALVECVRAFLLYRPDKAFAFTCPGARTTTRSTSATPEGRRNTSGSSTGPPSWARPTLSLPPADGALQPGRESRRLGLGESAVLRARPEDPQGRMGPRRDPVPPALEDDARLRRKLRGRQLLAYAYPSLPFLQDPAWTLGRRQAGRLQRRRYGPARLPGLVDRDAGRLSVRPPGPPDSPSTTGGSPTTIPRPRASTPSGMAAAASWRSCAAACPTSSWTAASST